ncbi:MAG: GTPase Era, partial [Ruminococcus sp.]|nr:GTPase Era [Ruminococcus sp.]
MSESKSVFVTIVGRANAGKSSLLNKLVGEKIAAVSSKPQTTRTRITGVLTKDDIQYVFLDTPGVHKAHNKLGEHMLKAVSDSVSEGELILMMADCSKKPNESEKKLVQSFSKKTKVILALNKTDLIKDKEKLLEVIT